MELKQKKIDAGLVSEIYPKVASMVIRMTYYQNMLNPVLMKRTVNVFPDSYAYFDMLCKIKGCENGGFDLTPIIKKMVKGRKKKGKGELTCKGKGDNVKTEHASVSYEINIKFKK
jgi:hypothetical protein